MSTVCLRGHPWQGRGRQIFGLMNGVKEALSTKKDDCGGCTNMHEGQERVENLCASINV